MSETVRRGPGAPEAFLLVASFVQGADNHLTGPLLPAFERLFGAAAADLLPPAYALGAAVLPFVVAAYFRGAARRLVAPGFLAHAAAAAAFQAAAAGELPAAVGAAARVVAGAASGVLSFALLAYAADAADPSARARRIAAQTAGFSSALVLGVPLGGALAEAHGARLPYLGLSVAGLLLAAAGAALARGAADGAAPAAPRTPLRDLLADRRAAFGLAAVFLVGAAVAGPATRLGLRLHDEAGLDLSGIGLVYLAAGLAPLATLPFAARALRAAGPARLAATASFASAAPMLAMGTTAAAAFWPAAALFFLALAGDVLRRTGLQALMAEAAPPADRARFLAVRGLVAQTGLALGMVAAAPLHRGPGGYFAVCAVGAALSAAGGLLVGAATRAPRPQE